MPGREFRVQTAGRRALAAALALIGMAALALIGMAAIGCKRQAALSVDPFYAVEWKPVQMPTHSRAGARIEATVTFRNLGERPWPGGDMRPRSVHLVERWLVGGADPLDGVPMMEVPLPRSLAPGEWTTLSVALVVPSRPGDYVAQFDLKQVGGAFFANRGAAKKLVLLRVE